MYMTCGLVLVEVDVAFVSSMTETDLMDEWKV